MTSTNYSLTQASSDTFGKELSSGFCETVATALLGNSANKVCKDICCFEDNWVQHTYDSIDHFDYIIGIARKGYSCLRVYLRIIKEIAASSNTDKSAFNTAATKSIILNSRTTNFYTFLETGKPIGDVKILIFDDLLNKGRNVTRIIRNLIRMGMKPENLYYSALGYHMMQVNPPKNDEHHSTWIETVKGHPGQYALNFRVEQQDDILFGKKIRLFLPYSLANDNFLENRYFFLDRNEINFRSFQFNQLIHCALIPYTAYLSSVYFNYKADNDELIPSRYKQRANDFVSLIFESVKGECTPLFDGKSVCISQIEACESFMVENRHIHIESNPANGYHSSVRIFRNVQREEILIYPFIILPSLEQKEICTLYKTLFKLEGDGISLMNVNKMIGMIYPHVTLDKGVDIDRIDIDFKYTKSSIKMKTKYIFEHMIRGIVCVLSAIIGIRFIEEYAVFDSDKQLNRSIAIKLFAKRFHRYFGVRNSTNVSRADYLKLYEVFLVECLNNYNKNRELFDFNSHKNITPNLLNMNSIYDFEHDTETSKRFNVLLSKLSAFGNTMEYIEEDDKRLIRTYLVFLAEMIHCEDELSINKIPPIPTFRIVELAIKAFRTNYFDVLTNAERVAFCKKFNLTITDETDATVICETIDRALFIACMQGIASVTEDGIANVATYIETDEHGQLIGMNALQCGEMTILIAGILLKSIGGWPIIRELQNIYLRIKIKAKRTYISEREVFESLSRDLVTIFENNGRSEPEAITLVAKIRYLFNEDIFPALTMLTDNKGSSYSSLLSDLQSLRKGILKDT